MNAFLFVCLFVVFEHHPYGFVAETCVYSQSVSQSVSQSKVVDDVPLVELCTLILFPIYRVIVVFSL